MTSDKKKGSVPEKIGFNRTSNDMITNCHCYYSSDKNGSVALHSHNYIELFYVTSGSLTARVNRIDYNIGSGDLLVLIPGDEHEIRCKNGCRYACFQINAEFLLASTLSSSDLYYIMPLTLSRFANARIFRSSDLDNTLIPKMIYDIIKSYEEKKHFYLLSVRMRLSFIAIHIFHRWDDLANKENELKKTDIHPGYKKLEPVLEIMKTRYYEDISAEAMSSLLGMSYSYFSRYFKTVTGYTFSEYLNSIRIKESERLLLKTDLSVAEISAKVGFMSTSYYIAKFKEQFHVTPKKFRTVFDY